MPLLFSVTRCCAFWRKPPKHIIIDIRAMFESISFDMPMPIGWPAARSRGAARSTLSHDVGRIPTSPQWSSRQLTGSGA